MSQGTQNEKSQGKRTSRYSNRNVGTNSTGNRLDDVSNVVGGCLIDRAKSLSRIESRSDRNSSISIEPCQSRNESVGQGGAGVAFKLIEAVNGHPTTLSTNVAKFFKKLHKNVIRSIETLVNSAPELNGLNFELVKIHDEKGELRTAYRMDRKGFVLLAMGFTGAEALKFKIAYIDAFDKMEATLKGSIKTISPCQQQTIKEAVSKRAKLTGMLYSSIYHRIHQEFKIARYDQLLAKDFEACILLINNIGNVKIENPVKALPFDGDVELQRMENVLQTLELALPHFKKLKEVEQQLSRLMLEFNEARIGVFTAMREAHLQASVRRKR